MEETFLLPPSPCPSCFPSEATRITLMASGRRGRPTPAHTSQLPPGGQGPQGLQSVGRIIRLHRLYHPRRKTTELGQEARLKPPPGASLPAEHLLA